MLKLSASARDPYWLDLFPGVRVQVRPATVAMVIAARETAAAIFREPGADQDSTTRTRVGTAMVRALAQAGIAAWEGVGDDDSETAPVTPENLDRFLDLWPVHDAMERLYVGPALRVDAEKNGSESSQNGISAEAPSTAPVAV